MPRRGEPKELERRQLIVGQPGLAVIELAPREINHDQPLKERFAGLDADEFDEADFPNRNDEKTGIEVVNLCLVQATAVNDPIPEEEVSKRIDQAGYIARELIDLALLKNDCEELDLAGIAYVYALGKDSGSCEHRYNLYLNTHDHNLDITSDTGFGPEDWILAEKKPEPVAAEA